MYLQKELQHQYEKIYWCGDDGTFSELVMSFMIVDLYNSSPFVIKAVPKPKIEGKWISINTEDSIIRH